MGSRVERVRYRIPTENKCEIPSTRRLFSRTTNGNRNQQGTKFNLGPSRRRILIQARIRHRNPPHVTTSEILEQSFRLEFHASNNEDEYEALIAGLRLAHGLKICNIHAYYDSQLVASQYSGKYEARVERMDAFLKLVQNLAQEFDCFALTRIPRSENVQADALAALASSSDLGLKRVILVEFIEHPSIGPPIVVNLIGDPDDDVEEVAGQPEERSEQSDYG